MLNYTKEELTKLICEDKISYRELGKINGVSDSYIKKYAKGLGIELPTRAEFPERWIPFNKGKILKEGNYLNVDYGNCKFCNKTLTARYNIFCDSTCSGKYTKQQSYKKYLEAVEKNTDVGSYNSVKTFKHFILEEQNNKCAVCELDSMWNNKPLVFVLDHVDGNAANNKRDNLRCVCPNCDSQLDTYKSKNKNSARKERYLRNYK